MKQVLLMLSALLSSVFSFVWLIICVSVYNLVFGKDIPCIVDGEVVRIGCITPHQFAHVLIDISTAVVFVVVTGVIFFKLEKKYISKR